MISRSCVGYKVRLGVQTPKLLKEPTLTTVTRKLTQTCSACVYNEEQLAMMLQAGLRNMASPTGIGPGQGDHETQSPGGKVKASDREGREVGRGRFCLERGCISLHLPTVTLTTPI